MLKYIALTAIILTILQMRLPVDTSPRMHAVIKPDSCDASVWDNGVRVACTSVLFRSAR